MPILTFFYFSKKFIQICYQMVSIVAPAAWAFVFTFGILKVIDFMPFMRLKLTPEEEELGTDWVTLGEVACNYPFHWIFFAFIFESFYLLLLFFETDGHDIPVTHKDFPLINKLNTDDDKNIELVVKTDQTNNLAEVKEHQEVSEEL
jgi:hypothetical protein